VLCTSPDETFLNAKLERSDWLNGCLNLASKLLIWSSSDKPLYSMFVRRPRPHHSFVFLCVVVVRHAQYRRVKRTEFKVSDGKSFVIVAN